MSDTNSVLEIQRGIVALERAKQIAKQEKLKHDIRGQIARNGYYNPEADPPFDPSRLTEYPKWVNGKLVQTREEEHALLGTKPASAKAVEVDVPAAVAAGTVDVPREKRKYTRKAAAVELPKNLE